MKLLLDNERYQDQRIYGSIHHLLSVKQTRQALPFCEGIGMPDPQRLVSKNAIKQKSPPPDSGQRTFA